MRHAPLLPQGCADRDMGGGHSAPPRNVHQSDPADGATGQDVHIRRTGPTGAHGRHQVELHLVINVGLHAEWACGERGEGEGSTTQACDVTKGAPQHNDAVPANKRATHTHASDVVFGTIVPRCRGQNPAQAPHRHTLTGPVSTHSQHTNNNTVVPKGDVPVGQLCESKVQVLPIVVHGLDEPEHFQQLPSNKGGTRH